MPDGDDLRPGQRWAGDGGLAAQEGTATVNSGPSAMEAPKLSPSRKPSVVVVGAGAFGGWTALQLLRRGARVTLLDAWGPGNSRSSSGDESRVIRGTYVRDIYTNMVSRARELWKESEQRWGKKLFHEVGVLWMVGKDDSMARAALGFQQKAGLPAEELTTAEAAKRFPQINFEDVRWAIWERAGGYLRARQACEAVFESFLEEGGDYRQAWVTPGAVTDGEMKEIELSDGSHLQADTYVFACGTWLKKIFPEVLGNLIQPTRQEVFYFGTPEGDARFVEGGLPVCVDKATAFYYAIPGNQWRGLKLATDNRGPTIEPTSVERTLTPEVLAATRRHLGFRFPAMKNAPLLESRVCQYEDTPDRDFIIDRHPSAENVWIVGGGSGHGFKHGPALGELVSEIVLGLAPANSLFTLKRFSKA